MSRSQDTVIDDDEETCPLCIEEFDLSDKNFKPCPCGYQICQFCFNSLKNTYEKSTCPNCRRPYDEKTIQYKIPTAEEFKLDQLNKNKKQAAAKRKETEKREVETSSRRNLAGVRVKQQNLVYVIGLIPSIKDETALLQTLRGPEYFGQYGEIEKIVVSKAKSGGANQGIGVYVTYARKEDAALCISTVDGSMNGDRILRAQFGTTKYCSAYLRGETCNNKNCSFLHETGEDGQHSSLQNEPHAPKPTTKPSQPVQMAPPPRPLSTTSQPMARQGSDSTSRKDSTDASALPSTASWANGVPPVKTRTTSQAASGATPSPQLAQSSLATHKAEDSSPKEVIPASQEASVPSTSAPSKSSDTALPEMSKKIIQKPIDPVQAIFDGVLRSVSLSDFRFVFDDSCLSDEDRSIVEYMPVMIDPFGGAKRRVMQDKEAAERAKLESEAEAKAKAQAKSAAEEALEEENMAAGSLALGGEPEEPTRSTSARGAIGRPSQPGGSSSFLADQFSSLGLNGRSHTPHQPLSSQQATGSVQQAPGLTQPPAQNTGFEMSDFERRNPAQYSAAQYEQISNHQRHGSRYFNNENKSTSNTRFTGQQQSFYSSGVQGPPPGLPTAGTPPISGGGMFAHGQGFTNPGFGTAKDANAEMHMRGRSGTNVGPDMSKRGGVEHLADPSIVQARIHQGGNTGQGLFGGNQDEKNFPPLPIRNETHPTAIHSRVSSFQSFQGSSLRSSTPKIPPGFETTHAHPPQLLRQISTAEIQPSTPQRAVSAAVLPAVPLVPIGHRTGTPKPKAVEESRSAQIGKNEHKDDEPRLDAVEETDRQIAEISSGSPKPRSLRPKVEETEKVKTVTEPVEVPEPVDQISQSIAGKGKAKAQFQRPTKIEIPSRISAAMPSATGHSVNQEKLGTPVLDSGIVATPPAMQSRPTTPATTTSEMSKASIPRPRTLRVTTTMTQKAEPAPASATTERSSILPSFPLGKQSSRQPSISSVPRSRPSTPALSERLFSHDVSRASSPPPSIIGSAPERVKTKAQQKKDRREKAKKSTDVAEPSATQPVPTTEAVAPVIARQKKQKKRNDSKVEDKFESDATTFEKNPSPKKQGSISSTDKASKKQEPSKEPTPEVEPEVELPKPSTPTPAVQESESQAPELFKPPYTLRDLYNDAAKLPADTPNPVQRLLGEHIAPMAKIISSMIASGDLSKDHAWLNPPSFNSGAYKLPSDSRRGQDYLDGNGYSTTDAFGYVYLPQKEKKALYAGHAVSVADSGNRKNELLRRCLITPNGWVMRHLSADESEKVLELEERRGMYAEEFGDVGVMAGLGVLEQDDYTNLGGGIEELGRWGERHGVCWVLGDEQQGGGEEAEIFDDLDDDEEGLEEVDDGLSDDETDDLGIDLDHGSVNMPGAWNSTTGSAAASGQAPQRPNTLPPMQSQGRNVNLRAMDLESLQKRVQEKQKELEVARKEVDKMEKAWNKKGKDIGRWRESVLKV